MIEKLKEDLSKNDKDTMAKIERIEKLQSDYPDFPERLLAALSELAGSGLPADFERRLDEPG